MGNEKEDAPRNSSPRELLGQKDNSVCLFYCVFFDQNNTLTGQIYIAGDVWSVQMEEFYFKDIVENWIKGDPIAIKENLKEEDFPFSPIFWSMFLSIRKKVNDIDGDEIERRIKEYENTTDENKIQS